MVLKTLFNKKNNSKDIENIPISDGKNVINDIRNWYVDRYGSLIVQRNILFLLLVLSFVIVAIASYIVGDVSSRYTIKPFVITVEEKTGVTNIVNPTSQNDLLTDEALAQYFVMKYINSRESYCESDYNYNYYTVSRLLSTTEVYRTFRAFIAGDPNSPLIKYNQTVCTNIKLRSISFQTENDTKTKAIRYKAVVRFSIFDTNRTDRALEHKIAYIEYRYSQMELNMEERNINPLGFQITSYRAVQENLVNF